MRKLRDWFGPLLNVEDSYYVPRNGEVYPPYPNARHWDGVGAGELNATQFASNLKYGVKTFITVAHHDPVVPTVAIPPILNAFATANTSVSLYLVAAQHMPESDLFGLGRPGIMRLVYRPVWQTEIHVPMPQLYDAGHTVSWRAPAELRADVMQWYFSSLE